MKTMKEEKSAHPEKEVRLGKAVIPDRPEDVTERPRWRASQECKQELGLNQQHCEIQRQEFLKTLQAPYQEWGNLQLLETTPWDDAKTFLACFEQVAKACHWSKEEWMVHLLPALSGEAQQVFSLLAAKDKEDYGKVKAAILRVEALRRERQRQHFRQFCCQEVRDPQRMYSQLQELCCQWLKPERHTKEQILELLILEQFLASLPVDVQSWIRAGGPDSGAQAVALLEDFLVSRRQTDTGTWQEDCAGSLNAKEELVDFALRRLCVEAKENSNEEIVVLGSGNQCSVPAISPSLHPRGQETADAQLAEGLLNLKEEGVSLHKLEQTPTQTGPQTIFWQVLQGDGREADSLEGLLVLKSNLTSQTLKEEEEFPVENETFSGQQAGCKNRSQLKAENSQCGGDESEGTPEVLAEMTTGNVPADAKMHRERCESNRGKGKQLLKAERVSRKLAEGLKAVRAETRVANKMEIKPLFSRYGRRYRYKPGLLLHFTGEKSHSSPTLAKMVSQNLGLNKDHAGEGLYRSSESGKADLFHDRSNLRYHWGRFAEEKNHKCPQCGKCFVSRQYLTRHLKNHTGEKPHRCTDCRQCFRQRRDLLRHQRTHTGEKPYECPSCGKNFGRKDVLLNHQKIHTGERTAQVP